MLSIVKQRSGKPLLVGVLLISFISAMFGVCCLLKTDQSAKAYLDGFDPGNIMDDFVMSNKDSMTEAAVQAFLKSKNPCNDTNLTKAAPYQVKGLRYSIRDGHFVCMADDSFNGESAAHIIWQAAQDYNINPQILIVILQKEQSLITDTWPNNVQYDKATGFGCPDTSACDPSYSGLKNQVRSAASLYHQVLAGGWSTYPAYTTQDILYHPNTYCGTQRVYIANRATSALYRYTPYAPNQAALNAGTGTGDGCSSYGNRNFYNYFTNWFGSTHSFAVNDGINEGYKAAGGAAGLGYPTMNEVCGLKEHGCYQNFERGTIYWTPELEYGVLIGAIHQTWFNIGFEYSTLGFPVGLEIGGLKNGGVYQAFQHGAMYYSPTTGAHENYGAIRDVYGKMGFENSFLGYPTGSEGCGLRDGGCYQHYQGGSLYWTPGHGGMTIYGAIRNKWFSLGYEESSVGYPSGGEVCLNGMTCYRDFEKGSIYWYNGYLSYANYGELAKKYREIGRGSTFMGYPTMDQQCGLTNDGCYQTLQYGNGSLYYSPATGAHTIYGGIKAKWMEVGYEWGGLGYPTSDEVPTGGGNTKQTFQRGTIYWANGAALIQYN